MVAGWKDAMSLAGGMSTRKLLNAAKVLGSYHRSRVTGKAVISGLPISLSIEPTTSCNLRCPECPSGLRSFTRPTGMLETHVFNKILDEVGPALAYLIFYFQGEPYLHPLFLDMVREASSRGIYTATSTNAHYLDEKNAEKTVASGLNRLIISIDGVSQEAYEQYRVGGKIEKVLEGTRNVLKARKSLRMSTPQVVFQFLAVRPNEHEIQPLHVLAKQMGVDKVVIKTAQIYDYEHGSDLIPKNEKLSRYQRNPDGTYSIKNDLLNHCWKMWHSCVMTWDGKILPCCFDKDGTHVMGDVSREDFRSIWTGQSYQRFRTALLKSRKEIEICRNCSEGTRVWA